MLDVSGEIKIFDGIWNISSIRQVHQYKVFGVNIEKEYPDSEAKDQLRVINQMEKDTWRGGWKNV